jgi:hypothetical protein
MNGRKKRRGPRETSEAEVQRFADEFKTDAKTFLILTAEKLRALSPRDRARYLEKLAAHTLQENIERLAAQEGKRKTKTPK